MKNIIVYNLHEYNMHIYMFFSSCIHAVKKYNTLLGGLIPLLFFHTYHGSSKTRFAWIVRARPLYPPPYFLHLLVGITLLVNLRFRDDYFRAAFHCIGTIYVNHAIKEPRYIPTQWVHSTSGHYLTLYNQKNQHSKYNHLTSHRRKLLS